MNLAIFGAKGYALGVYEAIKSLYPKRIVSFFIVSSLSGNSNVLGGVPVRELSAIAKELSYNEKQSLEIIIATPENIQAEIEESLENSGFHHYIRLNSERWNELMKMFHIRLNRFLPLSALPVGYNKPFVRLFMAKSHMDSPLNEQPMLKDFIYPLQVGASNAVSKIAVFTDNNGESISSKNSNYCELTGLYWIWKNKLCVDCNNKVDYDCGQYYGLNQYRRMLEFSEDDLLRLCDNDVDVVLPYPMPYEPNINAHHQRYLKDIDWKAMLAALREIRPEYAEYFPEVLKQKYLYNYNVILAKKAVLRDYCEWLFPILEYVEELSVPKGNERSDRYIGYMGETLETLYFMKNADKLNIVHTGCKLYS
ncbi:DUF4422 domain-containing protein [Butyrivibrio sp. NC3005]|uniref:DUF4422 domain-containing protein n=1 Tax=Butyrivibrio sp. NC3005 TaxID=1280685 RepID=UPI000423791C|nr:DUF4422 domain-containing protein [Butyrivibrio sp. NC3005]